MTVVESPKCVAYHFKQMYGRIAGPIKKKDPNFDLAYMKRYTLSLVDKAKTTKTQKRIRKEITHCASFEDLLYVVDRVIRNGENTKFVNY